MLMRQCTDRRIQDLKGAAGFGKSRRLFIFPLHLPINNIPGTEPRHVTISSSSYARKDVSGMKINASGVSMSSSRSHSETTVVQTATALMRGRRPVGQWSIRTEAAGSASGSSQNNVAVTLSERSKELLKQLKQEEKEEKKQDQQTLPGWIAGGQVDAAGQMPAVQTEEDIKTLQRLLEALDRLRESMQSGKWKLDPVQSLRSQVKAASQTLTSSAQSFSIGAASGRIAIGIGGQSQRLSSSTFQLSGTAVGTSATGGSTAGSGVWTRQTVISSFHSETENTAFSTTGIVRTADGREIGFNVQVEMSRNFLEANTFIKEDTVQIMTDPLVINLDTNVASVTDQKFLFDLDADGTMDQISFAGEGSGFLALDRNGDGTINDGTELFGTQSGDGFADLAAYDEDGNGWIDENDSVFDKLLIWSKDAGGNDRLVGIGKAGIGAIYLGSSSTEFSLKDQETNVTNGQIRRTGIYLKETGEAGTIQHVDLAL